MAYEMSTREAATLLRCSPQTVRNYWRAGLITGEMRLRGVRGKRQLWLERESVERLASKAPAEGKSL